MSYSMELLPQYRDAGADGLVGLKGYARYCQDVYTWFMVSLEKGNDVLPQRYGAGWIYTRAHYHLNKRIGYSGPISAKVWMEPYRQPVLVQLDVELRQGGELVGTGRMESCVFSLTRRRPLRLSAIEFPEDIPEVIGNDIPGFVITDRTAGGMAPRYERIVRYSDLDALRHMNNLRYMEAFEDALTADEWEKLAATDFEICYLSQCMEGERLSIVSRDEPNGIAMAALHENGAPAAVALFGHRA